jgi:hypothetical protein
VRRIRDWTLAIEDGGGRGAQWEILSALSREGGEAVAVQRHDYAQHRIIYAADDDHIDNPIPAALAIAGRITGVMISPQHLRRPVLGAAIPGDRF